MNIRTDDFQVSTVELDAVPMDIDNRRLGKWQKLLNEVIINEFLQDKVIRLDYSIDGWRCHNNIIRILRKHIPSNTKIQAFCKHTHNTLAGTWYFYLVKKDAK